MKTAQVIRVRNWRVAFFVVGLALPSGRPAIAQSSIPWNGRIYDTRRSQWVTLEELSQEEPKPSIWILGEKHQTASVQQAQAMVFQELAHPSPAPRLDQRPTQTPDSVALGWEFLDWVNRAPIAAHYTHFLHSPAVSGVDLLSQLFGSSHYSTYAPLFEVARGAHAELLPLNLTRAQKAPIVQGGITAADPALIPTGYERGGAHYLARFTAAMEGHATPQQIARYFDAQSLTDDVMALHLLQDTQASLRVMIVGSFHADYRDGVVARLQARAPTQELRTIRFVDCSDYTEQELTALPRHPTYGALADYLYYINEPTPSQ